MAFPQSILERKVEADFGSGWEDVSTFVYNRDPIVCSEGMTQERTTTQHARCSLTLDNRDDQWNRRNVNGPWYGLLGRNLPLRVSVLLGERYLTMSEGVVSSLVAPDSAGTSVTGDIDIRIDVTLESWRVETALCSKFGTVANTSWYLMLASSGVPVLRWSTDGSSTVEAFGRVAVPWPHTGRCALRATLDVNNGAGGWTVTYYTSSTPGCDGPWRQLGDPVTGSGVTSIFDGTSSSKFGAVTGPLFQNRAGRLHGGQIRNGIGGSIVASPTLAAQSEGASSFADGQGNTWTVTGAGATITARRFEHAGELAETPIERDTSGKDRYVPAVSTGILRRLGQGASPVRSTMRRVLPTIGTALRAYWPLEENDRAVVAASGLAGRPAMRFGNPAPSWGSSTGVFDGSGPLPTLNGATLRGAIRSYTSTGIVQVRHLLLIPAGGAADGAVLWRLTCGGTSATRVDAIYRTSSGGSLDFRAFNSDGVQIGGVLNLAITPALNGVPYYVDVELDNNGANLDVLFVAVEPGKSIGSTVLSGSITGANIGAARVLTLNPGGLLTDTVVGHVTVESAITSVFTFGRPIGGYVGERAGRRIERLCSENGITFVPHGDLDDTAAMGPQGVDTLVTLLRECETTDGGILFEPRDRLGLAYKPLSTFYTPGTRITLDAGGGAGGDLYDLTPTDDDQLTRNDITVTRKEGGQAREVLEVGALSVLDPPAGVGLYDEAVTVNVSSDDVLPDQAGWRLHSGTIDEPRFPAIVVELGRAALVAGQGKTTAVLDALLGDGVDITNPGTGLPPSGVRQVMVGRTVELGSNTYRWTAVGQPAAAYDVITLDYEHPDEEARLSSDGSTVNGAHTAGTPTLSVATPSGPLWGIGSGPFHIRIPETGEVMRVTNITGASSPQSFTVVRGQKGTTAKALPGGQTVELFRRVVWGL